MEIVKEYAPKVGIAPLCRALGVSRTSLWRSMKPRTGSASADTTRPKPACSLTKAERQTVLDIMHEERFVDMAPAQVWAALLDEGRYLCSVRTMYRILEESGEVKERRNLRASGNYEKPELLAVRPNQVWSWDITKLKGPVKWTYFYLYVILDIYSRYVVGWMLAHRESAKLAEKLIKETCLKQGISKNQLTLHADRGSSMRSKCVALLLSDLGVTKTHSRPHVSNDNPFSESQFKTLKYRPGFPDRFGSIEDARVFCSAFFGWHNNEHHHSGIALMTPCMVHYGHAVEVTAKRQAALDLAYQKYPERFINKIPMAPILPAAAWINPPAADRTPADTRLVDERKVFEGVVAQ